jgi:hypothetical protein
MHFFIDQKFESRWGNCYFVRNYHDSSLSDTAIGLVGVTRLKGRKCAFLIWAWGLEHFGGTTKYLQLIQADSVRFRVGPDEWWRDSVFWDQSMGNTKDSSDLFF